MKIELHIERLVLDGVSLGLGRPAHLQAAIVAELGRLLATQGLPAIQGGAVPRLAGGDIALAPEPHPVPMGRQIAHAVFSSLAPRAQPLQDGGSPA